MPNTAMAPKPQASTRRAKAALLITVASAASKPLGYMRDAVIAAAFGASGIADALFIAQSVPQVLFATISDALGTTFIPVYTGRLTNGGRKAADHTASAVVTLAFTLALILMGLAYLLTPQLVHIVAPGFNPAQKALAVSLTHILLPSMLLYVLYSVTVAYLQAHERFTLPALTGFPYNITIILSVVLFAHRFGVVPVAWGILAAIALQWVFLVFGLVRLQAGLRLCFDFRDKGLLTILSLVLPVVLSTGAGQLGFTVDRMLASTLPAGRIAALSYAQRLYALPVGIFVAALVTVAYPMLSQRAAARDLAGVRHGLVRSMKLMITALAPIAALLIVLRVPIVRLLFQHGSFTADDTDQTAAALLYFSLGLIPVGLLQLAQRVHFAMGDTLRPMLWGVTGVVVNIVADLILVGPLEQGGLALGTALNLTVNAVGLLFSLRKRLGHIGGRELITTLARALATTAISGFVAWLAWHAAEPHAHGLLRLTLSIFGAAAVSFVVYGLGGLLLGMDQIAEILRMSLGRLQRRLQRA